MTIDFTHDQVIPKTYGGANGPKICVIHDGEPWLLKFPAHTQKNPNMSYTNGLVSEYIGCHIFNLLGIRAQDTLLGSYAKGDKVYDVVACRDFTSDGKVLQDFASLKNTVIDSVHNGYGIELSDILDTLNQQELYPREELKEHFWNMFVVDALLGNWDRHNGNWGFLFDNQSHSLELAPVFDCGSCLYPQADEKIMQACLTDRAQVDLRIYQIPTSAIRTDGKRSSYFKMLTTHEIPDLDRALIRMVPQINLEAIAAVIDETPGISNLQKAFYQTMIEARKSALLDIAYEQVISTKEHDIDER